MALKKNKDGTWRIQSQEDLDAAAALIDELADGRAEIEQQMEEQYDYLTMGEDIDALKESVRQFMASNHVAHIFRDTYKFTLIRRTTRTWDIDKLKRLIPKGTFLKVVKMSVDPGKIDDLVRKGDIDENAIASAFVETPQKPFIQRFDYKENETREDAMAEELRLRQAMSKDASEKSGRKTRK